MFELHRGDCLDLMRGLPDGGVDLVLCDPPYGTMKGISNLQGMEGKCEWDVALDPAEVFRQLNRIVRPNGAVVLFSQEPYTSRLITQAHGSIPFAYRMAWLKDHFANPLGARKAPVSYLEDVVVFFKAFDSFLGHPLKPWMDAELEAAGMTRKQAVERWGSTASHYFAEGRQFIIPSADKLARMQAETGRFQLEYSAMKAIADDFRVETRRRFPRVFNLPEGAKSKSNVLSFKKDRGGLHPTQKPVDLMADLVRTYSNPGDLVLDFTMGSGTTGVACVNTGRRFIGMEMDAGYFEIARGRIHAAAEAITAANDNRERGEAVA